MPFFEIRTNKEMDKGGADALTKKASKFIADTLDKPEGYVMVSVLEARAMTFGGENGLVAFITLKSIGLPEEKCPELSKKICAFLEEAADIPADRVFIDFLNIKGSMFGWNGQTF